VELRRGIEGGVDRWSIHHGTEVGGGSARHDGARGEVVVLSRLEEEEGRLPPPQWASWAGWVTHADWPAGPTRPKVRKEFF
jgi:hypothetical protein